MNPASIPVDLRNPGQVFACLGLMEMTEVLSGPCMARFNYSSNEPECRFELDASENCIEKAVRFLARCKVIAIAPTPQGRNEGLSAEAWQVETATAKGPFFPGPVPDSPATLPIRLCYETSRSRSSIGWTVFDRSRQCEVLGGRTRHARCRESKSAIALLSALDELNLNRVALDPFSFSAPMSSSFRFDWRRDYVPLDAGFSPNKHQSRLSMVGFPLVELLAAVGVQNARPSRVASNNKLAYRYHVSNSWLPPCLVRACWVPMQQAFRCAASE